MNTTHLHKEILLIGAGNMAIEYAKVLKALKGPFIAVGRGEKSASAFEQATGATAARGGIEKWLKNNADKVPSIAIVAIDEENLGPATRELIRAGTKTILIEKPGGINLKDLKETQKMADKNKAKVFIAYNRRFYASTIKAREFIKNDGGVTSFNFDFTERSNLIKKLDKPPAVKEGWLLANSSHLLDLAFFLSGKPKRITSYTTGGLDWHPNASIYAGAGISKNGALFSYHANWESAGRWGVEIMTPKRKLIFRPLEKLQVQKIGSMEIEEIKINNELDTKFKPGLYRLTESFLTTKRDLPTISNQVENLKYYNTIDGK